VLVQWTNARNRQAVVREARTRLKGDLPGEPASIRAGHIRLEAEEKSLQQNLIAGRVTARETQEELDRLNGVREQTQRQQSEFDSRLRKEEALRHHCQLALQRLTKELPAAWQGPAERFGTAELFAWSREREDLIKADTDERGRQAQQAIAGLKMLRQDQEELERGQEAFPPEARREPAAVAELVVAARQRGHEREQELAQARQHRDQLDALRRQRAQLIKEKLRLDGELARARTLADLLGRDRLQLHLVRRAEHGIVDHANAVLDRLSGGQLSLKLREGDGGAAADEPLQLDAYNRTSGQTIHVAFLSGSQRFRVAVSLALGIGQYASRQHRPIESVIIDEGFGCLDRQSRQVMIQELQNLSGQLRCILLVSHQEEFADAFPHGYRFELENGSTRVTPLKP
jgi:DNA repair exonuclease SbcCD ATPase subunit